MTYYVLFACVFSIPLCSGSCDIFLALSGEGLRGSTLNACGQMTLYFSAWHSLATPVSMSEEYTLQWETVKTQRDMTSFGQEQEEMLIALPGDPNLDPSTRVVWLIIPLM